jgi:D-alanyl-D-alanine carboxypeptidase
VRFSSLSHLRPSGSLLVTAILLSGCSSSPGPSSPPSDQQPTIASTVDQAVKSYVMSSGTPGATVGLAQNGKMIYAQGYGYSDVATHQATKASDIFEIGSITKQFTAAIIMNLQQQGKLNVDDSMATYLPQYGFPSAITLRMLLTHTSGLANYTSFAQYNEWAANGASESTVLTAVSQAPLLFTPGTEYSYSNSNYFALGAIIEAVTSLSYESNLDQYIFRPLALQNTYFELPPAALAATGYDNSTGTLEPVTPTVRSVPFAAGALSTNVYDLVTWENGLMHGQVVTPASFKEMTTSNGFVSNGQSYGFGLVLQLFNGRPIMWHDGGIPGFLSQEAVFLDSGVTLVEFANLDTIDLNSGFVSTLNAVCNSAQLSATCGPTPGTTAQQIADEKNALLQAIRHRFD